MDEHRSYEQMHRDRLRDQAEEKRRFDRETAVGSWLIAGFGILFLVLFTLMQMDTFDRRMDLFYLTLEAAKHATPTP